MNSNVNFFYDEKNKKKSFIINWIIEFPIEKFYGWEFDTDFRYALNNIWDEYGFIKSWWDGNRQNEWGVFMVIL